MRLEELNINKEQLLKELISLLNSANNIMDDINLDKKKIFKSDYDIMCKRGKLLKYKLIALIENTFQCRTDLKTELLPFKLDEELIFNHIKERLQ